MEGRRQRAGVTPRQLPLDGEIESRLEWHPYDGRDDLLEGLTELAKASGKSFARQGARAVVMYHFNAGNSDQARRDGLEGILWTARIPHAGRVASDGARP